MLHFRATLSFLFVVLIALHCFANLVGPDAQNFNPTSNGVDFVTVQSARTLDPGILNFGIFANYAVNTLSFLEEADPGAVQSRSNFNDKLWTADLSAGLGLTKKIDVGLSLPFLLSQEIENSRQVTYFTSTGSTEQRVNAKYKFHDNSTWSNAFVVTANRNNIQNNPYTGSEPGISSGLEYASSWRWRRSWMGINLGHRWRSPGKSLASTFGFAPMPNMFLYSLAWSSMISTTENKLVIELFGATPSENRNDINLSNRKLSNLETLVGLKRNHGENLALHVGAGTGLYQGFGSPDWRIYAGLNWTIGPIWKKSILSERNAKIVKEPKPTIQRFILSNLRFNIDSQELTPDSMNDLQQVIDAIKITSEIDRVLVEGHTDSSGSDQYNLELSERRAATVKKLISTGVPIAENRIEAKGYGESQPIEDNSNYQGRTKNRRVVVTTVAPEANSRVDSLIEIQLTE